MRWERLLKQSGNQRKDFLSEWKIKMPNSSELADKCFGQEVIDMVMEENNDKHKTKENRL